MKTFLSIDWDYFIDATMVERLTLFPDGGSEKLAPFLSDMIWSTRYSTSILGAEMKESRKIEDIGVLEKDYHYIKKYLSKQVKSNSGVVIAESHAGAYQVFTKMLAKGEKCNIINIDYHHDLYTNNPGHVDCGNWLSEMYRSDLVEQVYWVARTDSDDLPKEYGDKIIKTTDLSETLSNIDVVDGVFLCRSGVWSPPHLDVHLIMIIKALSKQNKVKGTRMESRYTKEFKSAIEESYNQMKLLRSLNKIDSSNG